MAETIFALSSGLPPAAIAVVRISGPDADAALQALARRLPPPRRASLVKLIAPAGGELLDQALALRFPGPASATGEDLVELHLHGGRATVAGILDALAALPGLRAAEAGEFTRQALFNGRIDLAEAEGLADLLQAETASQRRAALMLAQGGLGRDVDSWRSELVELSAMVEAVLDHADEADVGDSLPVAWTLRLQRLRHALSERLARPPAERLKDGIRVVIAGPPNAGKSTLLNALAEREAAITSPVPGTTRDVIEVPVSLGGVPFLLTDTAGLRNTLDQVEAIGVRRAQAAQGLADIILWLGSPEDAPVGEHVIRLRAKADLGPASGWEDIAVSAVTGSGMTDLISLLGGLAVQLLPAEGEVAFNQRHRRLMSEAEGLLGDAAVAVDPLIAAESLRAARLAFDRITGRTGVEDVLDALFSRFCVGK